MDVSESYSGDELIPESCLESEWIDEDEVFAILKQWETRGGGGVRGNSKAAAAATGYGNTAGSGHILLNQSFGNENNISVGSSIPGKLGQRFVDTGTFTRPKKRIETGIPNSPLAVDNNNTLSSSHTEFPSGGSPLLNVQIGGPVTPSSLATPSALVSSTTGNRLLMQRSWLQDVSPPCSIMNSMEYSANEKITSSLITSGDFSSVGCLLNAGDDNANGSMPSVGNASYNGYNLYSVIEDRQRLENLCLDEESTLTKDCNISRTDLNAIESVSGVSTMQNSYESSGRTGALVGGKSSFEEESSPPPPPSTGAPAEEEQDAGKELINTTITTGVTAPNDTFELPEAEAERLLAGKLLLNGGGTYDARRPRNFNTYRKPRSSLNQTFEEVPHVDADTTVVLPAAGQTFVAPKPVLDKHAVMNSTFGIVGDEQIGGAANGHGTFVRNRTLNNEERDDVRLINLTLDTVEPSITPPPAVPFDRTFKRRPRNGTFIGGEDEVRHLPFDSPLRPTVVGGGGAGPAAEPQLEDEAEPHGQRTPNGTYNQPQQLPANSMLVQSTPFHGPSARAKVAPELEDLSPIGPETQKTTPTSGLGRTMVRRSRNLEQDLRNITHEVVGTAEPAADMLLELETDDFDVQIRRLPSATATTGTGTGTDISNFLDAEKRISLQHFEEFEKSILESEHSGIDFDEMLNSLTADVRRSDEASDKLRQSLDNIKKRHSRINLEKQQQDEMKRKLHQQQQQPAEAQCDNKLADSLLSKSGGGSSSMCSSSGSERLLNRRSRYNEDVHLNLSPQQQQQQQQQSPSMNATVIMANGGSEEGPAESADPVPTNSEVETYDRKNRDRFKTIRLGRRRDDSLGAVLPDVDQELAGPQPLLNGSGEDSGLSSSSSAFSRVDHNAAKMAGGPPSLANGGSRMAAGNGSNLPTMKTEPSGDDDEAVFKKPQAIQPSTMMQQPSGLARPGESRLRSTLSKPRYYGAAGPLQGTIGGIQRKDLTLPLGNKSSSADCLEQREEDDQYLLQQPRLSGDKSLQQQQPTSRLATMSKLGGGSGGLLGTGRYSQFGLANKQLQLQQNQTVAGQPMGAPALKSPMGTKSKSYHSLTFAQANNSSGYGGSSGNLSKLHGSSALQLKLKHNSSNTELSGGVQMRTASGLAKTSRLGLIRPSSGYFSYSTHRKHPDSDNESVNSLSSSSASSRGSLYRVDSQSIANGAQPPQFASATRTNSVEDVSGTSSSGNGLLTKLNGTGAGMGPGVLSAYASIEPPLPKNNPPVSSSMPAAPTTTGLKQPTAATGGAKPSGLRPPSAIRPPTVRSGLPRPTSYIRR
ncbi:uncharacterized protein LOC1276293 isoform X4 [Anopheles gambiae]|uniref:uncharacterized protein LOC1276293 isoform X4 n=1 Tax=Anopheles gambiae TaxID=7165 RepID=UPI002AC8BFB7|nr:uncharacterized protein LOC1276293 isoform X4 [Anopheles gambiae]